MKLANLRDVPLEVLQQGVDIVRKYAQALLVFDEKWNLVRKEVRESKARLPVIAVIGPSEVVGAVLHLEIGFRNFLPYRKASKKFAEDIYIPPRYKILDLPTNWPKVIPPVSEVMQQMAAEIIRSWKGWDNTAGFPIYHARSFRTSVDYVKKLWLPPKDGISFHISEFDKEIVDIFLQSEVTINRRFLKRLKGMLGVVYVIQKHFDLYVDINKKRRREIIREVLDDSTLPKFVKDSRRFKALLSASFRSVGSEVVFQQPQEFVTFLKKENYLPEELWREYFNFCAEIETHRKEYKQAVERLTELTNDIQILLFGIKQRRIEKKNEGKLIFTQANYYTFKVYDDEEVSVEEERTFFDDEEEVPF